MPDWSYTPLEPIASAVLGERRTHRLALGLLATLVRTGGRRWIPVVFDHPQVPDDVRHRLGAQVGVEVARDAVTVLPVQGATLIHIAPVTMSDIPAVRRATENRRCRVVAICDSSDTVRQVAPYVDRARVGADPDAVVLDDSGIDAAVCALSARSTVVLATTSVLTDAGPGWFHRVIEARAPEASPDPGSTVRAPERSSWRDRADPTTWSAWVWAAIAGVGLVAAGVGAAVITLGPVLLGYDRDYLGLSIAGLNDVDTHLVGFLQHDRITMAGNMVGLGALYIGLAWGGIRRGQRWARTTLLLSGIVAFGTWFYFLAGGFIEPLHTTVVVVVFPILMIAVLRARTVPVRPRVGDGPIGQRVAAMWAQLLMIGVGGGLAVAGVVISVVGLTAVFVPTDLGYLETDAATLRDANEHLLPFIAHDRAGFGGALVGSGLAVLLISMWGWRRGEKWVWWSLLIGCVSGTVPALAVHLDIGYTTVSHLLPLYVLMAAVVVALVLARPFLTASTPSPRACTNAPPTVHKIPPNVH